MNRKERRAWLHDQHAHVNRLPDALTLIPRDEYPPMLTPPIKAWRSRKFIVQLYEEGTPDYPKLMRLTVNRTKAKADGRWRDELTWDELQTIKREVGFGNWYAVEVYPPDRSIVNVANLRHLWMLPAPLGIGWNLGDF